MERRSVPDRPSPGGDEAAAKGALGRPQDIGRGMGNGDGREGGLVADLWSSIKIQDDGSREPTGPLITEGHRAKQVG